MNKFGSLGYVMVKILLILTLVFFKTVCIKMQTANQMKMLKSAKRLHGTGLNQNDELILTSCWFAINDNFCNMPSHLIHWFN